jgi:Methylamine utilisation protein MauE
MSTAAQTLVAIVLIAAAALKLRDHRRASAALATYGITRAQGAALACIATAELAVAAALLAAARRSPLAAAALFGLFAAAALAALAAGRAGRPCACFGAGSRLSGRSTLPSLAGLAIAIALGEHWLAAPAPGFDRWAVRALVVGVVALVVLAAAVLALAREVGVLRLSLTSQGALELDGEGPRVGEPQPWAADLPVPPGVLLGLAIFSSPACPMCRRLEPAIDYVAADPLLSVRVFDEVVDRATWAAAEVPGSPYAVALDGRGVALAKGTFNSLVQLEGIIATARERDTGLVVGS